MKILVAEDDMVSNKLLVANLKKWGHEVVSVLNGKDAHSKYLEGTDFDIAILDWMMPDMEGVEVCKRIKEHNAHSFAYVIILTAKTQTEDIVKALDCGADDYITKPFVAAELRARVMAGERIVTLERSLRKSIVELEQALSEVKTLQGILPVCAWCKRVRDDSDYWHTVEEYISNHSEAEISHSICPTCLAERYPDDDKEEETASSKATVTTS